MDGKRFVLGFSAFALCLALTSGFVLNIEPKLDRDIYIREYQNASCTLFQVLFGSSYKTNETTTCRCSERNLTTCTTEVVYTTTTAATTIATTTTTAAPTTGSTGSAPPADVQEEGAVDESQNRANNFQDFSMTFL